MRTSLRCTSLCIAATTLVALPSVSARAAPRLAKALANSSSTQPTCGSITISKADGGLWQCTFDDEFDGTSLSSANWIPQVTATSGFHSGKECFVDDPNNISVANGVLSLTVRAQPAPFTCASPTGNYVSQYTSGMVSTVGNFSQTLGRFEVRAKLPSVAVKGLQESLWLWPVDPAHPGPRWSDSGEIDIAEFYSRYPNLAVPYVHYVPGVQDMNVTSTRCAIRDDTQYHTYAVEWTSSTITVIHDGAACIVDDWSPASWLTKPAPFDQPFIIALTQALGITTNAFDPTTTPLPATTQIDYVRAWK